MNTAKNEYSKNGYEKSEYKQKPEEQQRLQSCEGP